MSDKLDEVYEWYQVVKETHKVSNIFYKKHISDIKDSMFIDSPLEDIRTTLDKVKSELDDLTVLSLVSVFEAQILDYLKLSISNKLLVSSNTFIDNVNEYATKQAERWKFTQVLDFFKGDNISSDLVGQVKNVYAYRNWVSHGKKEDRPSVATPENAYRILKEFLRRVDSL